MEAPNEIMAFCCIRCSECQAYKATQAKDTETLAEVAKKWSSDDLQLGPEDVLCDGCQSEKVFNWAHNCTSRTCGLEKGVENCVLCGEYVCEKLEKHWGMLGEETRAACKANLDNYRNRL